MAMLTSSSDKLRCGFEPECLTESTEEIIGCDSKPRIGCCEVHQGEVQECPRYVLWPDESFELLHGSGIFAVFCLGSPNRLEDIVLLRALKVHDNSSIVSAQAKSRVVFSCNRGWGFINVTKTEYVVNDGAETLARMNFLLSDCCDLDELTADLDYDFDFALRFRKPGDWRESVTCVAHCIDSFLW